MRLLIDGSLLIALAMCAPAVRAGVMAFDLTPSTLSVLPGGTIEFTGTLTNTGTDDVYLNGDVAILPDTDLSLDDSPFFADSPLFLSGGQSYDGPFFDVTADATAIPGTYGGSFAILGGADGNTFDNLAAQDFTVTVASGSPEPNSSLLIAVPLLIAAGILRFRRYGQVP